jgi:sulfite exporter TauE/SafE
MQAALAGTALLMGLAAGPHCVAMCGVASASVIRIVRTPSATAPAMASTAAHSTTALRSHGSVAGLDASPRTLPAAVTFHLGRLASYAAAGALAATTVQGLALASGQVAALRPLWMLLHVFILAWGLLLAASGRQPLWATRAGHRATALLRTPRGGLPGLLAAGALWVAMPCGLLYSALMLAALGNGPFEGAALMASFAGGSALSLLLAPWLWRRLRDGTGVLLSQARGNRLAGALLAAVALQAIGMDLWQHIEAWCR